MYSVEAFGSSSADAPFEKITIQRNECGVDDVEFDILYCGICHTDVHFKKNDLGGTKYPIVPGHELAGVVTKVGENVDKCVIGDHVGVGCIVESCLNCDACADGDEHQCEGGGMTMTYNDDLKHGQLSTNTGYAFGGYSRRTTVNQRFIIRIPHTYPLKYAGPIFCAGITMFSPLKYFGAGSGGKRVGIAGIGGLGQMGIQLAAALGNEVTAISTNPTKEAKCKELGAKHFILSTDKTAMESAARSLDLILNTISANHSCKEYLPLLTRNATLVQLGLVLEDQTFAQLGLMFNRQSIAGSLIGGMPETQECIDLCAEKNIRPDVEVICADQLDSVYEILNNKNDTVKRYVLDLTNSKDV